MHERAASRAPLLLSLAALLLLGRPPRAEVKTGSGSFGQAVVSESSVAASDAAQVLSRGGTAADAAIVAALVAGVAAPSSSGLGGGGFALGWDARERRPYVLDFRELAPSGLLREPFERRPLGDSDVGHLVGVPGEARGLFALHERAGKLPWADLVRIAERRASVGYSVSPFLARMAASSALKIGQRPALSLLYPQGKAAVAGTRVTNARLAKTLAALAARGPGAIYEGEIADEIVSTVVEHGGRMVAADLASYRVAVRQPLSVRYAGADVYTMPAPSAGGLLLAEVLGTFPPDELRKLGQRSPAYKHLLAEAMRGALADRARYAVDPDVAPFDVARLVAPERLEQRKLRFGVDRTHALPTFLLNEHGTHALLTADRQGNVVSLTTTVNNAFGSGLVTEKSGIVLNDELDDFSSRESAAFFGLEDSPNRPRPGARPVSSMTPTLVVENGAPRLALGGSGGLRIGTNVTQVLLDVLVFGETAQRAVTAPRFSIPLGGASPGTLRLEGEASPLELADLTWRGEIVSTEPTNSTAVQVLAIVPGTAAVHRIDAAADPRKSGGAVIW